MPISTTSKHGDGKVPVDALALRHIADQASLLLERPAEDLHAAAGQRHQPQDRLDQRALARAVGPDDAHQARLVDRQIDVPQHRLAMVGDGDVVNVEDRRGQRAARGPVCGNGSSAVVERSIGQIPNALIHSSAFTIVSTLCRTMPS